jgi:type II restriction/modification system DNA methylase subunit YeeA
MRFIRKEHIVTTIFNKELEDSETIRTVFTNLFTNSVDFSIIVKKYMSYQEDYFNISFEKARVTQVNEDDSFNMLVFKKGIKTTMKNVHFSDVVEVSATTRKHNILDGNDALTRWEILDFH